MWWKTTQVYRAHLPYTGISQLTDQPIEIVSNIGVFTFKPDRAALLIDEMTEFFRDSVVRVNFHSIRIDKQAAAAALTPAKLERIILQQHPAAAGDFIFIEWPKLLTDEVLVTAERTALISSDASGLRKL